MYSGYGFQHIAQSVLAPIVKATLTTELTRDGDGCGRCEGHVGHDPTGLGLSLIVVIESEPVLAEPPLRDPSDSEIESALDSRSRESIERPRAAPPRVVEKP
ncbi:hypothetical protein EVAR_86278_1 [Eumeta japonica]|uniref:Uncharacterized protein n=1 Tax=Eumeta variegata TaxID=151549 RepID=A0A4C1UBU2_EUMVA|nr:hypothetical protein EVAR_86278_1 [Eumeta japonica]